MLSRPPIDRIAFWGISWYGLLIFSGILIGIWITTCEQKRLKLPEDTAIDFLLVAIPLGIIGARLYSVLFRWSDYADDFWRIFNLREGGLAIFGAVLGGLLAARLVSRRKRISFLRLCDMAVLALILAQAIGRWGNYINMEAYGLRLTETAQAWKFFPIAVEIPVGSHWYWHMATFFYESMWDIMAFIVLMWTRRKMKRDGDLLCWYVLLYGAGRTIIEGLRSDSLTFYNEFVRVSQILSALACVAVVILFCFRQRSTKRISGAALQNALLVFNTLIALSTCFIGEFERGAYGNLFFVAQTMLLLLFIIDIVVLALRLIHRCPFHPLYMAWCAHLVFTAFVLAIGLPRAQMDNTFYVSLRQIPCVIQCMLSGALFYYAPYPAYERKRKCAI